MNWGLIFIIDDWAIISAYKNQLKGRVLLTQFLKIWAFNVLIATTLLLSVYSKQGINWFVGFTVITLLIFLFRLYLDQNLIKQFIKLKKQKNSS